MPAGHDLRRRRDSRWRAGRTTESPAALQLQARRAAKSPSSPINPAPAAAMVIWLSDDSDSDNHVDELPPSPPPRNPDAAGPSTRVRLQDGDGGRANGAASFSYPVEDFMAMGFSKEIVLTGIKTSNGDGDPNKLLELLLTLKKLDEDSLLGNPSTSGSTPRILVEHEVDSEDDVFDRDIGSDGSEFQDFPQELSLREKKIKCLLEMGFPEDEAQMAITRCGLDCDMLVLVDSIHASQATEDDHKIKDNNCINSSLERKKSKQMDDCKKRKRLDCRNEDQMRFPNPIVGFNLPDDSFPRVNRKFPSHAIASPYFYLEKVAVAPQGVWETISSLLYNIKPEIVDTQFFSASTGKRSYLHNLPVDDRCALPSPMTILEAFPQYAMWWPWWDQRLKLNCLRTRLASAKLVKHINCTLAENPGNPPAETVRKHVLEQCRIWNLLWVGKNRVAALEPHEMELILGYPKDHTRGVCVTERYRSLGNAFQVDTIACHLSVLKKMFPNGVNVLSLFSGIGGAELALHRLGIPMKMVVSVETSAVNKWILRRWWDETQKGRLIQIDRVESLTHDRIESLVREVDGFDLVIGGSPCNNLIGGSNGLEGEYSALFHDYVRILRSVRLIMETPVR